MKKNKTKKLGQSLSVIIAIIVCGVIILGSALIFYVNQSDISNNFNAVAGKKSPLTVEQTTAYKIAHATTTVAVRDDEILGRILVDGRGMTLYTYNADEAGVSHCDVDCARNWPPVTESGNLTVGAGVTGSLAIINRADGVKQVTYNNQPLYYWKNDSAVGDATGGGVENKWFVAKP